MSEILIDRNICHELGCKLVQSCCHDITSLPVADEELQHFPDPIQDPDGSLAKRGIKGVYVRLRNPLDDKSGYEADIVDSCPNNEGGNCTKRGLIKGCSAVPVGGRVCNRLRKRDGKGQVPQELIYLNEIVYQS